MPEPVQTVDNNPNTPNPAPAATPAAGDQNQAFDLSKLDNTAWEQIYTSPRFKELIDIKNEHKQLKAEKAERERKELEQKGEYEKLAKLAQEERDQAISEAQKLRVDTAIERAAIKAGAVDSEAVLKLLDRSAITLDENGQVQGIAEALQSLQTEKAYLFGKGATVTLGSPTNPNGANTGARYKLSQLQDHAFYQKNEADIRVAMKEGRIDDDLPH